MHKKLGNTCVIIGSQWGDEGKGKLVDIIAEDYDIIARAAGGANAGHTIEIGDKKYVLHLMPSGILQEKTCIIGNGCVISLPQLLEEITSLESQGIDVRDRLFISDRAQLLFDFHKEIDAIQEERKGDKKIGSTKRGIGPCYTTKIGRSGLRIGELINDFDAFAERFKTLVQELESLYKINIDTEAELIAYKSFSEVFTDNVIDTVKLIHDAREEGANILVEGAQGAMLDVDHGTYPFVTSSNTCVAGSCAGLGIAPTSITSVLAITKAYTTRVGAGPFPTELHGKDGEMLRQLGHEFGATTGRPRRCGWLDIVQLKSAMRVNGFTHINLTKLDVLSGMPEIKLATKYTLYGEEIHTIPLSDKECEELEIEYETFPGWTEDISGITDFSKLPKNAQKYVEAIEKSVNCPISFIGTGAKRNELIVR